MTEHCYVSVFRDALSQKICTYERRVDKLVTKYWRFDIFGTYEYFHFLTNPAW